MIRIPYGFALCGKNLMAVSQPKTKVVHFIFDRCLLGQSLGGIVKFPEKGQITAPTGNLVWGRAAIDKLLSNGRYVRTSSISRSLRKYNFRRNLAAISTIVKRDRQEKSRDTVPTLL